MFIPKPHTLYLLTGAVQSGKTTTLTRFIRNRDDVAGVLAPVQDGHRHLCLLPGYTCHNLETGLREDNVLKVGRFRFNDDVFARARAHLLHTRAALIIVDEIGPLELEGRGLEPALSILIKKPNPPAASFLLVVRQGLLAKVRERYGKGFRHIEILGINDFRPD